MMLPIHESDNLVFYIKMVLIITGILALLFTVVYTPYEYQNNMKNIIIISPIQNLNIQ